jgi:hypothetical protein
VTRNMKMVVAALAAVVLIGAILVLRGSKEQSNAGAPEQPEHVECNMKPCGGPVCDKCVNENCDGTTSGCQTIADAADRRLCEDLYACFTDPAHDCTNQGDPLKCWCGTNPTTCITDNSGPTQANGVCAKLVLAAAKTNDAAIIRHRLLDPQFPLGRAANLTVCRGGFCSKECAVK